MQISATYPESIKQMCRSVQNKPAMVSVETEHQADVIEQLFYHVKKHERNGALLAVFEHYQPDNALVFCHTKKQCDEVASFLYDNHIDALAIHGDLEQRDRDKTLARFANNSCPVLVATDVASRGLDIKALAAVINYELPRDPEVYVHRVGRTGRAGKKGIAVSLFADYEQVRVNAIEQYFNRPCICDMPESLDRHPGFSMQSPMVTIEIDVGRKNKIRPGDLLGALTGDAGLAGAQIGKIDIMDTLSFVAVEKGTLRQALNFLSNGKVKGRSVRARKVR